MYLPAAIRKPFEFRPLTFKECFVQRLAHLGTISKLIITLFDKCTLYTDPPGGGTDAVARYMNIAQITCRIPQSTSRGRTVSVYTLNIYVEIETRSKLSLAKCVSCDCWQMGLVTIRRATDLRHRVVAMTTWRHQQLQQLRSKNGANLAPRSRTNRFTSSRNDFSIRNTSHRPTETK